MTVTYSLNVSKARLCGFAKLLLRWRGSIYKLLYREIAIFCGLYYSLSLLYRYILTQPQRKVFESVARYCDSFTDLIPLSFVLGFYVSIVVGRWWQQYMHIPWPDKTSMLIAAYVHGNDERGRMIRRTLARYLSLLSVLTFQGVSTSVKKRFPTLDHLEEAGLMTKEERMVYDETAVSHGKWWVPAQWFCALAVRARKEGRIKDDQLLRSLLDELHVFRGNCGMLFSYDWISIPLVYTQVVTLAIYTYFLATVMGRQYLDPSKKYEGHEVDLYIPVFTLLQFFFYMGWLKVAEQLINPLGEDDDDFELNWCLDRNLQVSFMIVDEMYQRHPRLVKDQYWDEAEPQLPYTKSSVYLRTQPHLGSAINLDIDPEEAEFVAMETIMEDDNEEHNYYNSPPTSPTNELLPPNYSSLNASKHTLNDNQTDTASQSGFKVENFGAKIINMIMGTSASTENVNGVTPKKDSTHSFIPSFIIKTPSRRSCRTSSVSDNLNTVHFDERRMKADLGFPKDDKDSHGSDEGINITVPRRSDLGTIEERRSLILNRHASVPHMMHRHSRDMNAVQPNTSAASNSEEADTPTDQLPVPPTNMPNIVSFAETTVTIEIPNDQEPTESELANAPTVAESPYEPNSSQESLSPLESNQSTVSSYAELLSNPK